MGGFENVLTFADLKVAATIVAPIFLRDTFLNFLFGVRVLGIVLIFVFVFLSQKSVI